MHSAALRKSYYPALDGLRGIAIIMVVLYHIFSFVSLFNYGWLGVDLFFVLSGFLITEILIETKENRDYFKNFYMRRVLRIFPLYYLILILIIIILPAIKIFPFDLSYYKQHQLWYWFYLENWLMTMEKWENRLYILNHFWSLAIEEQFYIVWPFIIFLIKKPKHLFWLCFSILLLVVSIRIFIWNNRNSYPLYQNVFLFTRADGILAGAMLALQKKIDWNFLKKYSFHIMMIIVGINIISYILKRTTVNFPYWAIIGYPSYAILFALLVYHAISEKNRTLNFILNIPGLTFLGKISYGLYVFHWPVYLLLHSYFESWIINLFGLDGINLKISVSLSLATASFFISIISYYLFERIWLKLKDRYR